MFNGFSGPSSIISFTEYWSVNEGTRSKYFTGRCMFKPTTSYNRTISVNFYNNSVEDHVTMNTTNWFFFIGRNPSVRPILRVEKVFQFLFFCPNSTGNAYLAAALDREIWPKFPNQEQGVHLKRNLILAVTQMVSVGDWDGLYGFWSHKDIITFRDLSLMSDF